MLRFLVYSNLWISLGALLLTFLTYRVNDLIPNYYFIGFVFCSTLFSYLFQRISRLKSIAKTTPNSWIVHHSLIGKILLIVSFIAGFYLFSKFYTGRDFTFYWFLILAIISAGYSAADLRDFPYIKIIMISVSWGVACGILPFIIIKSYNLTELLLNFSWIFCYILAITIPFDIRDIGIDEERKKTIPQWLGIKNSKVIALLFLFISIVLFSILVNSNAILGYIVASILAGYLIVKSTPEKTDLYYSFGIDGHIIFLFMTVFFLC